MAADDIQVGGDHYKKYGELQPWAALEEWLTEEEFRGFLRGDLLVYIIRYRDKGGTLDLKKARHVIDKLIEFEDSLEPPKQEPCRTHPDRPLPLRCSCYDFYGGAVAAVCLIHNSPLIGKVPK